MYRAVTLVFFVLFSCNFGFSQVPPTQTHVLRFGDSIATAASSTAPAIGSQFTMEAWIYLESASPFGVVMGRPHTNRSADPFHSYVLSLDQTGRRIEFVLTTGQPGSYRNVTAPSDIALSRWTHVAATLTGGTMRLYINGSEAASGASSGAPPTVNVPFAIGNASTPDGGVTCCGFLGAIRQVRVWNRALTGSELSANITRSLAGTEPGIIAYWPFDDGSGQTVRDLGSQSSSGQMRFFGQNGQVRGLTLSR